MSANPINNTENRCLDFKTGSKRAKEDIRMNDKTKERKTRALVRLVRLVRERDYIRHLKIEQVQYENRAVRIERK